MTIHNNAQILFNGKIPDKALEKLKEFEDENFFFSDSKDGTVSVLEIEEKCGDITDDLNEIVNILKSYGIVPLVGECNRYYGDYDGYDVFTGEKFEPMDDESYGMYEAHADMDKRYGALVKAAKDMVYACEQYKFVVHSIVMKRAAELKNALDDVESNKKTSWIDKLY